MCHTVHSSVHTALLGNTHCSESLVWLQAGFCYTINSRTSLGLLSELLLFPCVTGTCSFDLQALPLHVLQQFRGGVDVGAGQLTAGIWVWVAADLVRLTAFQY